MIIRLHGTMAETLVRIDPDRYKPCLTYERGKPVLYAKALKALYGTLNAPLLFWKYLSGKLELWGFKINPYDICVANKMINGKQCTVLWHVDDLKISHVDLGVVEGVGKRLRETSVLDTRQLAGVVVERAEHQPRTGDDHSTAEYTVLDED